MDRFICWVFGREFRYLVTLKFYKNIHDGRNNIETTRHISVTNRKALLSGRDIRKFVAESFFENIPEASRNNGVFIITGIDYKGWF